MKSGRQRDVRPVRPLQARAVSKPGPQVLARRDGQAGQLDEADEADRRLRDGHARRRSQTARGLVGIKVILYQIEDVLVVSGNVCVRVHWLFCVISQGHLPSQVRRPSGSIFGRQGSCIAPTLRTVAEIVVASSILSNFSSMLWTHLDFERS